jgi:hypothetical protein
MAKANLANMSVESLLHLRANIEVALRRKAKELSRQLFKLDNDLGSGAERRSSALKGRRVPVKYRDRSGNTWAGRVRCPSGCAIK